MIQHCRFGRIQEIYTKSISRFARNISECIQYTRELKGLGVIVHFEKEGITTEDENIEMVLMSVFSATLNAYEQFFSLKLSNFWTVRENTTNFT